MDIDVFNSRCGNEARRREVELDGSYFDLDWEDFDSDYPPEDSVFEEKTEESISELSIEEKIERIEKDLGNIPVEIMKKYSSGYDPALKRGGRLKFVDFRLRERQEVAVAMLGFSHSNLQRASFYPIEGFREMAASILEIVKKYMDVNEIMNYKGGDLYD